MYDGAISSIYGTCFGISTASKNGIKRRALASSVPALGPPLSQRCDGARDRFGSSSGCGTSVDMHHRRAAGFERSKNTRRHFSAAHILNTGRPG